MQRPGFPFLIQTELVAASPLISAVVANEEVGAYLLHECNALPLPLCCPFKLTG
jgi:hypothetical protein